jgi:hypothetical protein
MACVMLVNECCGPAAARNGEFLQRECPADALQRMAVTGQPGTAYADRMQCSGRSSGTW